MRRGVVGKTPGIACLSLSANTSDLPNRLLCWFKYSTLILSQGSPMDSISAVAKNIVVGIYFPCLLSALYTDSVKWCLYFWSDLIGLIGPLAFRLHKLGKMRVESIPRKPLILCLAGTLSPSRSCLQ